MDQVGTEIFAILEWAGTQYLKPGDPDLYRNYLLHIGGTDTLQHYDGTETYWDRVQIILDTFFTSSERAGICAQVIGHSGFHGLPEFRGFWTRALAERRLQNMLRATAIIHSTRFRVGSAAARRSGWTPARRRDCEAAACPRADPRDEALQMLLCIGAGTRSRGDDRRTPLGTAP